MENLKFKISALAFLLLSLGCDKEPEKKPDTNQNTSNDISITVDLPDGWTKVNKSILEHDYQKGTGSFSIKNEYVLNGKDLEDAVIEAKTYMGNYFESAVFSNTQNLKIDGYDAQSFTFTFTSTAADITLNMKMLGVYTMVNNKCYLISFGGTEDSFDALSDDFQYIIKGIKFKIKTN